MSMKLQWLIVGGGIHGVHLATRLLGEAEVPPEKLRVVDPAYSLLERWRRCTAVTGMSHLRSPSVHHLDLAPHSLQRFAGQRRNRRVGLFAAPYARPALELFNSHCKAVIELYSLDQLHLRDRATRCSVDCDRVMVQLASGEEIETQHLVLAIGASEQPHWPQWAPRGHPRAHHIFDPGFDAWPGGTETVAVVGGGISAAQVALRLVNAGHHVHLVARHELRQHQFDSEPGWLGPKYMRGFAQEKDPDERRSLITEARHRGSVPPDVRTRIRRVIDRGFVDWYEADVADAVASNDGVRLTLSSGQIVEAAQLLLATGFDGHRPGGSLVDELVSSAALPCASCGYPIVDTALRWHPRVFVSGPLAELEIGPVSRNIAGARRAGNRLISTIR